MFSLSLRRFHSLILAPILIPMLMLLNGSASNQSNQPPVAVDDSITIHGFTSFGAQDLLANDSDPDGDPITFDRVMDFPQHGELSTLGNVPQGYRPNAGYTGPDSFTYRIQDYHGLFAVATVTLDVRNSAPTPGNDSITIHGFTSFGAQDLLANDSDPDGDPITFNHVVNFPYTAS